MNNGSQDEDEEKININPENQQNTTSPEATPQSTVSPPETTIQTPIHSNKKRLFLIIGAVLILILAAGAILYKNHHKATTSSATDIKSLNTQKSVATNSLDTLVYALRVDNNSPFSLYWQSINGDTKQEALKLTDKNNYPYTNDIRGQKILINMSDGLYVSQDGGRTYKKIYSLTTTPDITQAITSAVFTTDGQKVAFGFNDGSGHGNKVGLMNLDGSAQAALWSDDAAGVFLKSYNTTTNTALYQIGCYFCDGAPSALMQMNTATKTSQQLFTIDTATILDTVAVSNDGTKALYITGVSDEILMSTLGGPGWAGGPPYTLKEIDIPSGKTTTISTIGTLHQKDSAGNYVTYYFQSRYINNSTDSWYSYGSNLYAIKNGTPSLVFQSNNQINSAELVSSKTILIDVNNEKSSSSGSALYSYDVASKKTTKLLDLNQNVILLGITTE